MYEFMTRHWHSPAWRHLMWQHMHGPRRSGMYHWMYGGSPGWGWLPITLCVLFGLALLGAVVYGATRLAPQRAATPR